MTDVNIPPAGITTIKQLFHENCSILLTNLQLNKQSLAYGACSFELNNKKIHYRVSKLTPVKVGQFVTIWKRNKEAETEPYAFSDDFDFIIISATSGNKFGYFIFPKDILALKGIITTDNKQGKRGIRVYPPWDIVESKQAKISQAWQTSYFHSTSDINSANSDLLRMLLFK